MREVKLPSGAILKVSAAPFAASKALYQAFLKEAKTVEVNGAVDITAVLKQLVCAGFSSTDVERCMWECCKRCLYNNGKVESKIDESTFEPVAAREDFTPVWVEVGRENVLPFMNGLYAEFQKVLTTIESSQA